MERIVQLKDRVADMVSIPGSIYVLCLVVIRERAAIMGLVKY